MEVHQFTDLAYTHLSFIARNASGLPSPSQTLFPRTGDSLTGLSGGGNCSTIAGGHGISETANGTCLLGRPSAILYTVLDGPSDEAVGKLKKTLASIDTNFNDHFKYPVAVFGYQLTTPVRKALRKSSRSVLEFHELDFLDHQPFPAHVDK
jgi:hypothetical protein